MIYSHSRLQSFETCPQKFKFQYIDKIKTGKKSVEAFLGNRVHETLEKLYKELEMANLLTLEELFRFYDAIWAREWSDETVTIVRRNYTQENYLEIGRRCIQNYYEKNTPFQSDKTLGIEQRLAIQINDKDRTIRFQGFIDRLAIAPDGTYEIHDYKTSKRTPTQQEIDSDKQLALYQVGIKQKWPDIENVKLVWHFLQKGITLRSSRTHEQLTDLQSDLARTVRQIESAKTFPTVTSALCGWCEFRDICPAWGHKIAVQALPENKYKKDTGVQLVNRFIELSSQREEIKKRLEEIEKEMTPLREAALSYAENHGIQCIDGPKHTIEIQTRETLPSKEDDSKAYQEVEKLFRQSSDWQKVSRINPFAIIKGYREQSWTTEILQTLKKLIRIKTDVKLIKKNHKPSVDPLPPKPPRQKSQLEFEYSSERQIKSL